MTKKAQQTLGDFLRSTRNKVGLSLREVEDEIGISNAYLSQLEGDKIKQPSPKVLHKLSELYRISYSAVMGLAGYPVPDSKAKESVLYARIGSLSEEEEDAVVDYIEFLRSRSKIRGRR